ncbi:bifunctional phosphoribosyl-AMP cyclohydrolase/phosphoribosyl-ATP diphosphatase HisIE [Candidatus Micrarchaeota archaeon]|nr:bifunctional phosphoribosyl-AMP cyclohydrolase/phosphoribosyl-ATP diphosphatase HisIE [Candidatus Micrarchaeota archaeon]
MKTSGKKSKEFADSLDFSKGNGLVVAVAQSESGEVLMVAFQNVDAVMKTLSSGRMWYWSRSKSRLWMKGEKSGNVQDLLEYSADCDKDCVLYVVRQKGVACHTGSRNCFNKENSFGLRDLFKLVEERKRAPVAGSYTNKLLADKKKIVEKVIEECGEVVEAFEEKNEREVVWEACDVLYHLFVLCASRGVSFKDLEEELARRHCEKQGNKK